MTSVAPSNSLSHSTVIILAFFWARQNKYPCLLQTLRNHGLVRCKDTLLWPRWTKTQSRVSSFPLDERVLEEVFLAYIVFGYRTIWASFSGVGITRWELKVRLLGTWKSESRWRATAHGDELEPIFKFINSYRTSWSHEVVPSGRLFWN